MPGVRGQHFAYQTILSTGQDDGSHISTVSKRRLRQFLEVLNNLSDNPVRTVPALEFKNNQRALAARAYLFAEDIDSVLAGQPMLLRQHLEIVEWLDESDSVQHEASQLGFPLKEERVRLKRPGGELNPIVVSQRRVEKIPVRVDTVSTQLFGKNREHGLRVS